MSSTFQNITSPDGYISHIQVKTYPLLLAIILGSVAIRYYLATIPKKAGFPLLNPAKGIELTDTARRNHFTANSVELLRRGHAENGDRPFNLFTDAGEVTVLPSSMAHYIRNDPQLAFLEVTQEDFHGHLPGFEAFSNGAQVEKLVLAVLNKHLTKFLNKVTKPLSDEAGFATELRFGTSKEWQTFVAQGHILDIVARMSSRVFLGEQVCRQQDWLDITKAYTVTAFMAADKLRVYTPWLRRIVHWFMPECQRLRLQGSQARKIITPVIQARKAARDEALKSGLPVPVFEDALDWFEDESGGVEFDTAVHQLSLSMAAIHTTTDLLTETLLRLAQRPELVEELRGEIVGVLREQGWKKTALFNMKLLDSVIKETQRIKPIALVSMTRKAKADIKLPTGDIIPKGARTVCSTALRLSEDEYTDPQTFDGTRFRDWRGTERDSAANLVSTGPASLGFGHGKHACPGRFFAANEIKVALCHLLIKYDWKMVPGENAEPFAYGFNLSANPMAKVMVRRRESPELDLDQVE